MEYLTVKSIASDKKSSGIVRKVQKPTKTESDDICAKCTFFKVSFNYGQNELDLYVQDGRMVNFLAALGMTLIIITAIFLVFVFKNYNMETIIIEEGHQPEFKQSFVKSSYLMITESGFVRELSFNHKQKPMEFPKFQKTNAKECSLIDDGAFGCVSHHFFASYYRQNIYYFSTNPNKNVVKQNILRDKNHHREIPKSQITNPSFNKGIVYSIQVGEFFWIFGGLRLNPMGGGTPNYNSSIWSFKREKWIPGPVMQDPVLYDTFGGGCAISINSTTILHLGYEEYFVAYLHIFSDKWLKSTQNSAKAPMKISNARCTIGFDKDMTQ